MIENILIIVMSTIIVTVIGLQIDGKNIIKWAIAGLILGIIISILW
jgi:hypothetical protein